MKKLCRNKVCNDIHNSVRKGVISTFFDYISLYAEDDGREKIEDLEKKVAYLEVQIQELRKENNPNEKQDNTNSAVSF